MKSVKIFVLFVCIPSSVSAVPFQKPHFSTEKPRIACANFQGLRNGECVEEADGRSFTYASRYEVTQDGCESVELRDPMRKENRAYGIGRTSANVSNDFDPFISVTTYAQWREGGQTMNIDEFASGELVYNSQKKIFSSTLNAKLSYVSMGVITLSQTFFSSTSSESGSGQYRETLHCQYKITQ